MRGNAHMIEIKGISINILEVITVIVLIAFIVDGFRTGFIMTAYSIVKMIIGSLLAAVVCAAVMGSLPRGFRYVIPAAFVIIYGIVVGILGSITRLLNLINKIPIAKQINSIIGLAAGMIRGVIVVWLIFFIAGYFIGMPWSNEIYSLFEKSTLLTKINTYNPLMQLLEQWQRVFNMINV